MTVAELIEKLKTLPADDQVKTWDAIQDNESAEVFVSTDSEGSVWIMANTIGYPVV